MKDSERKARLLELWWDRPRGKRTEHDVLAFYGELERLHPELLSRRVGDPYQNLKSDLVGYIEEPKRWYPFQNTGG
jgi:hypothetical protein